jgi:hydrogenase maturation factor
MIESDYTISNLAELKNIVRMGIPLPAGKFPNDLLKEMLEKFAFDDPSVLINPGVGEDTAAVNVEGEEVLILKSDPITFATDAIGHYAVLVNANDIATSGALPRWSLTTLLFPCGTTGSQICHVMYELKEVCSQWGITLCGGHTEITDAVTRPVVTGMLAGTVAKQNLIDKRNIRSGDRVLLTKGVAVEGTSIIGREFGTRLKELGMGETEIETCKGFLSHISILEEARIASSSDGTSAMHDVTEGGVATALEELSIAGRHRIRIHLDQIPILPETEKICRLLDIHPLGLIGSGSLLICCRQNAADSLIQNIQERGTEVTCIGEVTKQGSGIEAFTNGHPAEFPRFDVDEITRLF